MARVRLGFERAIYEKTRREREKNGNFVVELGGEWGVREILLARTI